MFNPRNILVPTDFSENSEIAFQNAIDIAKQNKSDIFLLHVNEVIQQCVGDYCLDPDLIAEIEDKSFAASREMLETIITKFPQAKGLNIKADVKKGVPYEEILKEQADRGIDLIVMASHRKKGIFGHLLGSVAERITRAASCPVLVVKG
jgi:nucleotide-binding universal stress UspA family protein